jgi:CheY-like chemotaxis protein
MTQKPSLVVEDQEDLRGILRDLLTGTGYEVVEASDGRHGVAKAKAERPDLILMDLHLPIPALQLEQPRADRHTTPTQGWVAFADHQSSYSDVTGNGSQSSTHFFVNR